jgi:pyruvate,water dikinase
MHALIQAFKLSQAQAMYCLDANNYIKIEKTLKKYFGDTYKVEVLAQSLPGCVTQNLTIQLNEYAKSCGEAGKEPHVEDPEFQEILDRYGVRANVELDFGTKRWREDPAYLLNLVMTYITDGMYERNLADIKAKKQEALAMIEEVTEKLAAKIGKRKAEKFHELMVNYRYGAAMREYPKYDIVRFLDLARQAVQKAGEDLVEAGDLDDKDDIFFLRKTEILEGSDLRTKVATAKEAYDREMKRTTIPRMLVNNGHTYYSASKIDPNAKVLQGMALSAGVYEGFVRVVFDPRQSALKEGEILVTESANPAWTPLFATAGALIMEYGGPMSHGGIVAREYGIPAVVGIPSAAETLKDGQRVRVNGETGTVEIL